MTVLKQTATVNVDVEVAVEIADRHDALLNDVAISNMATDRVDFVLEDTEHLGIVRYEIKGVETPIDREFADFDNEPNEFSREGYEDGFSDGVEWLFDHLRMNDVDMPRWIMQGIESGMEEREASREAQAERDRQAREWRP